jgi:hypothetical protein
MLTGHLKVKLKAIKKINTNYFIIEKCIKLSLAALVTRPWH